MSSAEKRDEARTWYFKASDVAIARPEGARYDPTFFSNILDACKTIQMRSISKADTICYSTTEINFSLASVEGFIHSGGKIARGTLLRWLANPAILEEVDWIPLKND